MRFRQPAILHGLPRQLALANGESALHSTDIGSPEKGEHVSLELLRSALKNGSSLGEFYIQHMKDCRDCRDFVAQFCPGALNEPI